MSYNGSHIAEGGEYEAQSFKLLQMLMGQIAQNRCYNQ